MSANDEALFPGVEQTPGSAAGSEPNEAKGWAERIVKKHQPQHLVHKPLVAALRLPPQEIRRSTFANRDSFNWESRAFLDLKAEIAEGGGNRVPILVRPLDRDREYKYEIAYGHRRHQACLELGLDVQALVQDMTDAELVLHMATENRQRKDLCPLELGRQYLRTREMGKFTSIRALAKALGMTDHSTVGKYIRLAELPDPIVRAFKSQSDIQVNWAPDLHAAYEMDCMAVLEQANLLSGGCRTSDAKYVFERLCGAPKKVALAEERNVVVEHHGRRIAMLVMPSLRSRKGITIHLEPGFKDVGLLEAALLACWSGEIAPSAERYSPHSPEVSRLKAD
jgi:ParB family chromosome partitioning protein